MRGEIQHLGAMSQVPQPPTEHILPHSRTCVDRFRNCVKCLKVCNKFENYYCNMPDINVIENGLCGHMLDTLSHLCYLCCHILKRKVVHLNIIQNCCVLGETKLSEQTVMPDLCL